MAQIIVKKGGGGLPAWVMTFADLMSLLLAFFVLLFSFSELDRQKFKELSGSMKDAFGVQRELRARQSPKGISYIAREFSPGRPQPTPLNVVRQDTTNDRLMMMALGKKREQEKQRSTAEERLEELRSHFAAEIESGLMDVETEGETVILRIREKGSFPSGSATLEPESRPVIDKIGHVIREVPGNIKVVGHTDDRPIATQRFRSNWELASGRAVTVLHHLIESSQLPASRFHVEGYGDTRPVADNQTAQGRSLNRRVEVILTERSELGERPSVRDQAENRTPLNEPG